MSKRACTGTASGYVRTKPHKPEGPNPLHHTFFNGNTQNRATNRKYTSRTEEFKRVKRKVKEYILRQHCVACVTSFMVRSTNRK